MDFFAAQDRARRQSRLLLVYFVLALVLIIGGIYVAVIVFRWFESLAEEPVQMTWWDPQTFRYVALGTLALVLGGTLFKVVVLARGGGRAVAEALGGRRLSRTTADPDERRLLNIVDEMAVASGLRVPPVYLLDGEFGINAFAAGLRASEAVVAVTRGALTELTRDELQGVIGHEFSHILNGDMALNIRLIGVVHGILLIALIGRGMLRAGGRHGGGSGRGSAILFMVGLALLLIGYIGAFFGQLIKAAVSRQREFLADAAAVQFTRNPQALAGALARIGGYEIGSRMNHPRAEEVSHMLFGTGVASAFDWLDTHPPLAERIDRLDPALLDPRARRRAHRRATASAEAVVGLAGAPPAALTPEAFTAAAGRLDPIHVAYARALIDELPSSVLEDTRHPGGAVALVYALLIDGDAATAARQLELIGREEGAVERELVEGHREFLRRAGPRVRLPLIDLLLPSLEPLDAASRARFLRIVDGLILADRRFELFEYTLRRILRRQLAPARRRDGHARLGAIREDCQTLLALLANLGNLDETDAKAAFAAGAARIPLDPPLLYEPNARLRLKRLDAALARLATLAFKFRRIVLEGCVATVARNRQVTVSEGELLRVVAEALEVPVPPLLPGQFRFAENAARGGAPGPDSRGSASPVAG